MIKILYVIQSYILFSMMNVILANIEYVIFL